MPEVIVCALIGAIAFRLRGDAWLAEALPTWGTLESRLLYAGVVAIACTVLAAPWSLDWRLIPLAVMLWFALWVGSVVGWWASLDMGTQTGTLAGDIAKHSARGVLWTLPAGLVVGVLDIQAGLFLAFSGVMAGPLYAAAMLIPIKLRVGPVYASRPDANGVNTELGEVLFGAWIGACLSGALLAV